VSTARQPHVVLIALGFPPSSGSGAYRGLGYANHLSRLGWRVTVLTVTESYFDEVTRSRDDSLLPLVDSRVEVLRVPMRQQHLVPDARAWGPLRGNFRALHDDLWSLLQARAFPEQYAGWILPLARTLIRLHRRDPVDAVIASANPWSAFAGAWLAHRIAKIPYVMDYRDAWTLDQVNGGDEFPDGHLARRWERRFIDRASRIFFVNEATRRWHAERYPRAAARMRVVPNGYDDEISGQRPVHPPKSDTGLRFGYLGTVTDLHPHAEMWSGWAKFRADDPTAEFDVFGRLGFFERSRKRIAAMLPDPETSGVSYRGPVPKVDVAAVYDSLDVLVLMIGGSQYITSGKIFECLTIGKPVVLVCDPGSDAVGISRGHPLVHAVQRLDGDSVAEALREAADQAPQVTPELVAEARRFASRYARGRIVESVAAELEQVRGDG
jgi:glycosyltransferase involved in cell wall biosynthesis